MKTEEVFLGTSKLSSFGMKHLMVRFEIPKASQTWEQHVHSCLCVPEQHDKEKARRCKAALGSAQESH